MKRKLMCVLFASLILTGCTSKVEVQESPEVQEQRTYEDISVDKPVRELKPTEDLKQTEPKQAPSGEQTGERFPVSGSQGIIFDGSKREVSLDDKEERIEPDIHDPGLTLQGIEPVEVIEEPIIDDPPEMVDFIDIADKLTVPADFVMEVNLGLPSIVILVGQSGDYKLTGIDQCFMWESPNGTFYSNGSSVKKVEVSRRSAMFTESSDSDSSDGFDMNIDLDNTMSEEELQSLIDGSISAIYLGVEEVNGVNCWAYNLVGEDEEGNEQEIKVQISMEDYSLRGMGIEQDGVMLGITVCDWGEFIGDLENKASGTIDDETATSNTQQGLFGSLMTMMFSGMANGDFDTE